MDPTLAIALQLVPLAPRDQTPEALAFHQKAKIQKWWPIIKDAHIRAE